MKTNMPKSAEDDPSTPAFKRARTQDATTAPLDIMARTQAQLQRSTDPHLQAKLLLDYSALAVAPEANTEAAIDFLFAFLQRSQTSSIGDKEGDSTKSPVSGEASRSSSSNAVVVAAIVRGLRGLLAVNPSVVEPMIQLDAMGEQLTQCVSVPEDFKLRRDMLRIVVDCLVQARKLASTEQLLQACMDDHDDGLRAICLDGYIRLLDAGHHVQDTAAVDLISRLSRALAISEDTHTRELAARVLGRLVTSTAEEAASASVQETVLNALASNARDPSPCVRQAIAFALRRFAGGPLGESSFLHLLQKTQINEDLSDIEAQSVALLTNGALLTLMEDEHEEVTTETSTSVRLLCEGNAWGSGLIDRAVSSHMELAARAAKYHERNLLTVLANLHALLAISKLKEGDSYPLTREELLYLLGSLPTNSLPVTLAFIKITPLLTIDHAHAATRIVTFMIQCSAVQPSANVHAEVTAEDVQDAMEQLGGKWSREGVSLPVSTMADLREAALTHGSTSPVGEACRVLHDTLCVPSDRLDSRCQRQTSQKYVPAFLKRPSAVINSSGHKNRPLASAMVEQIADSLETLQRVVSSGFDAGLDQSTGFPSAVTKRCEELLESCQALLARTQRHGDTKAKTVLAGLIFVSAWATSKTPSDVKALIHYGLTESLISPAFRSTLTQLQDQELTTDATTGWLHLVATTSVDELKQLLSSSKIDAIASASITLPDESALCTVHEVSSQLPFALRVQCTVQNVAKDAALFVKARLPSGELTYTPLHWSPVGDTDSVLADASVKLHFRPFSDPTQVVLAVCMKIQRVFCVEKTEDYVEISPATKLQVQHRSNPALRHQNSRSS